MNHREHREYDIAVLGATPAGMAAACVLARRRLRVVVVDAPRQAAECPLSDWVPGDFFRVTGLPRKLARQCGATPFRRVAYHSADLAQQAEFTSRSAAGYFVHYENLVKALRAFASHAGAEMRRTTHLAGVRLHEDSVELDGKSPVRASLLIVAQDRPERVVGELGLPVRTVSGPALMVAGLNIPAPPAVRPRHASRAGG